MLTPKDREILAQKPAGLRKYVDLACKDCIYDEKAGGTWRKQVENCPVTLCPLWNVRPRQAQKEKADA